MSEIIPHTMTKIEQYNALVAFGEYMSEISSKTTSYDNRINHIKNISDDIQKILYLGEPGIYGPHPKPFLESYNTYNQMVQAIYNGTIFNSDKILDAWVFDYKEAHKHEISRKLSKSINSFKNKTFIKKIENYMKILGIECNI